MSKSPGGKTLVSRLLFAFLIVLGSCPQTVLAQTDAKALFEAGLRRDLGGTVEDARVAYDLYLRAAEDGLTEAQFNVAVMLDNGRGVAQDISQAATWYARAAARGSKRAAFNLGQLYEAGEGVPENADLAKVWYEASALPAARARAAAIRKTVAAGGPVSAPTPVAPPGPGLPRSAQLEFVWTATSQPEPVRYFVEVSHLVDGKPQDLFASFVETSSIAVDMPAGATMIAWRVIAVGARSHDYVPSRWTLLSREQDGSSPGADETWSRP